MKRVFPALFLLALASPAQAIAPGTYYEFTRTASTDTRRHIAIVEDDYAQRLFTTAGKADAQMIDRVGQLGNLIDMLEKGGIEVHRYTYSQFHNDVARTGHRVPMWEKLGQPRASGGGGYAVALLPFWPGRIDLAGAPRFARDFRRYFRACSTSAQLVHLIEPELGGMPHADFGAGSDDSTLGSHVNSGAVLAWTTSNNYLARVTATGDTLFGHRLPMAKSTFNAAFPAGMQLVRVFSTANDAIGDSVITTANDTLLLAYRVRWNVQGHALTPNPYAEFVLGGEGGGLISTTYPSTAVLWATLRRHLTFPSVPAVFSLGAYGSLGPTPYFWQSRGGPWSAQNPAQSRMARGGFMDSLFKSWRANYHLDHMVVAGEPDSAKAFWAYDPSAAAILKMNDWTTWSLQYHNSDSLTRMASTFGYTYPYDSLGILGTQAQARFVANRFNPGNATAALRYGLAQRIAAGDSAWRSLGLAPSSFVLPGTGRLIPGSWARDYRGTLAITPAESLFTTLHATGKVYLATSAFGSSGSTSLAGNSANSATGVTWGLMTDEVYTTAAGKKVHVTQYGLISASISGGPLPLNTMRLVTQYMPAVMLGLIGRRHETGRPPTLWGGTGTNQRCYPGRVRAFGAHPQFLGNDPQGWNGDSYAIETGLFKPLKALEYIAGGNRLVDWTTPEVAWSRY